MKRIAAITGIVLIVALYVVTLILAIFNSPATSNLLMASFFLTFFIPILIYAFILMDKFMRKK